MNVGQIVRSRNANRYTALSNQILQSQQLSLIEKGLLGYLLSLPHDWAILKTNLHVLLNEKEGTVDRAFRGLQKAGFILSVKITNEKGHFMGWNHIVYDEPTKEEETIRHREKPMSVFTDIGKSAPIQSNNVIGLEDINNLCVITPTKIEIQVEKKEEKMDSVEANAPSPIPGSAPPLPAPSPVQSTWDAFMHWVQENNVTRIFKMDKPFTPEGFYRVYKRFGCELTANRDILKAKVKGMENKKDLLKKYVSAEDTLDSWLRMHRDENPGTLQPHGSTPAKKRIINELPDRV